MYIISSMHSFVIQNAQYSMLNIQSDSDTLIIEPENSIGIDEVRQVQSFLSKKPIGGGKNQVYLLMAELLTVPAQNALLKTLEEPPGQSEVYLVTDHPDQLLPTVLSRVQVVAAPNKTYRSNTTYTTNLLTKLRAATVGERLKILDEQKFTRESLLEFVSNLEFIIHQDLSLAKLYPAVMQTRIYLKANCNLKLCLAYLALKF